MVEPLMYDQCQSLRRWNGSPITTCQLCGADLLLDGEFIDGKTHFGPWAIMCLECHEAQGFGLGIGKGQHYQQADDGEWYKTGG